jgi:hypothetical protein
MASEKAPKKLCFVISPIGDVDSAARIHADWLLKGIVEPVTVEFSEFTVRRADQDPRPGLIDVQMIDHLLSAELVIADLSFLNPNVFYEIGIRHMAQKPIIHMQLATEKPPFDVSLYRAIKFSLVKPQDLSAACAELKVAVEAVLATGYQVENPVTNARGRIRLQEHATPEQLLLQEQIEAIQHRLVGLEGSIESLRFLANVAMRVSPLVRVGPSFLGGSATEPPSDQPLTDPHKMSSALMDVVSQSDPKPSKP